MFDWFSGRSFCLLLATVLLKVALIVLMLIFIYYFRPIWLIHIWKWYRVSRAGLKKHCLKITNELEISYLERKGATNSEVVLFLHGLTGDKEIFSDLVKYLPAKFHVILIDLPGHGESKPDDKRSDYRPTTMVDYVYKFVKAFGFGDRKLNIIGTSMGGAIAGVYAARYGDETLSSVVLVCPAGIKSPEVTEFLKKSSESDNVEGNLLLPKTSKDFKELLKLVMYNDLNIPTHVAEVFVKLKQSRKDVHKKVMSDMSRKSDYFLLDEALKNIKQPLLCVWGQNDQILHVSGTCVVKERVKDAEVHVLDKCGHAIVLERPRKLVKVLVQFLERVHEQQPNN